MKLIQLTVIFYLQVLKTEELFYIFFGRDNRHLILPIIKNNNF